MKLKVYLITILIGFQSARGQEPPLFLWSESISTSQAKTFNEINSSLYFSKYYPSNTKRFISLHSTLLNPEPVVAPSAIGFQQVISNSIIGLGWQTIGYLQWKINQWSIKYQHLIYPSIQIGTIFHLQQLQQPEHNTTINNKIQIFGIHSYQQLTIKIFLERSSTLKSTNYIYSIGANYKINNLLESNYECSISPEGMVIPIIAINMIVHKNFTTTLAINVKNFNPSIGTKINLKSSIIHLGFMLSQYQFIIPSTTYGCYF